MSIKRFYSRKSETKPKALKPKRLETKKWPRITIIEAKTNKETSENTFSDPELKVELLFFGLHCAVCGT